MKPDYVMDPAAFDRTAKIMLGPGKNAPYGSYSIISSQKSNDVDEGTSFRWPRRELIARALDGEVNDIYIPLLLPNGTWTHVQVMPVRQLLRAPEITYPPLRGWLTEFIMELDSRDTPLRETGRKWNIEYLPADNSAKSGLGTILAIEDGIFRCRYPDLTQARGPRWNEEMVNSSWLKVELLHMLHEGMDQDLEGMGCAAMRAALETAWLERHGRPEQPSQPVERNIQTAATRKRRRPKRDTKLSDWFTPQEQSGNDEGRDETEPIFHEAPDDQGSQDDEIPVTH
eukprot:1764643-Rhodomonas_salina.1